MAKNNKPLTRNEHRTVTSMAREDGKTGRHKTPVTFLDRVKGTFSKQKQKRNDVIERVYDRAHKQTQAQQAAHKAEQKRINDLKRNNK